MDNQSRTKSVLWISGLASVVLLAVYVWLYTAGPFTTMFNSSAEMTWNDFGINLIGVIAAAFSAVAATLVSRCYERSEPIFFTWLTFAIGLWIWCLAELSWMIYNLTLGEVPNPSLADVFWIAAYILFTMAIVRQYSVIYRPTLLKSVLFALIAWIVMLGMTLLVSLIIAGFDIRSITTGNLVNVFYPIADLTIAVAALYFIISFRRGAMARPWLGLFAFAVADSLYAWLYESGLYSYTTLNENTISIFADTIYIAAYLVLAIGLVMHFLLIRYGPSGLVSQKLEASTGS